MELQPLLTASYVDAELERLVEEGNMQSHLEDLYESYWKQGEMFALDNLEIEGLE